MRPLAPLQAMLLAALVALGPYARAQSPTRATERAVAQGDSFERELRGGEAHLYALRLEEGQYARIVVEQKGVDVVLSLFAEDGVRVAEVDGYTGASGPEPLAFVAPRTGTYRLEVRPADERAGRYELKFLELRTATGADVERIAAAGAAALARREADELVKQSTVEARTQSRC